MKDTYYFQHDYEPTSDPKIQAMLGEFGAVGYGMFWRIIEMLHSDENHRLPRKQYIYLAIAQQMLTSVEQVVAIIEKCINVYELLSGDDNYIWSERVNRNIEKRHDTSEKRSKAGKISAASRKKATSVKQVLTSVEQKPTKERKGKKRKEQSIPELSEVKKYFTENGYTETSAEKAFNYYNIAEWSDSTGKKVLNWKQKMRGVWFKDENIKRELKSNLVR